MPETKQAKCVHQVVVTEFHRLVYRVEAEDAAAALTLYECLCGLGALPKPKRTILGRIEPPEQVLDESGKVLYQNTPPPDDAERLLFVTMWRRMREAAPRSWVAVAVSMEYVCLAKGWRVEEIRQEVLRG